MSRLDVNHLHEGKMMLWHHGVHLEGEHTLRAGRQDRRCKEDISATVERVSFVVRETILSSITVT